MLIMTEVGVEVCEIIEQVFVDFKDNVRKGQILIFTLLDKKIIYKT
jgi:hypothetical protein